jgi:hypothetical protein
VEIVTELTQDILSPGPVLPEYEARVYITLPRGLLLLLLLLLLFAVYGRICFVLPPVLYHHCASCVLLGVH